MSRKRGDMSSPGIHESGFLHSSQLLHFHIHICTFLDVYVHLSPFFNPSSCTDAELSVLLISPFLLLSFSSLDRFFSIPLNCRHSKKNLINLQKTSVSKSDNLELYLIKTPVKLNTNIQQVCQIPSQII